MTDVPDWKTYVEERKGGTPHEGGAADISITPLHCAVWSQDIENVRRLLEERDTRHFRDCYTEEDPKVGLLCELPAHYAARIGSVSILAELARYGADMTARTCSKGKPYGPTVLHFAVARGYPEAVRVVLEMLPRDEGGGKASMNKGDGQTLEWLQEIHNMGPDGLRKALEQEPDGLTAFLDQYPNETLVFLKENPLASQGLKRGDPETTNRLLEQILKGPLAPSRFFEDNPRAYGDTPLQEAVKLALGESYPGWMDASWRQASGGINRLGVVEELLKAPGVDADAGRGAPRALWWATRAGNAPLVRLLLAHGADPLLISIARDRYVIEGEELMKDEAESPLSLALSKDRVDLAELMLPYVDFKGTAYRLHAVDFLYEAVRLNYTKLVQVLLKNGANPFSWSTGAVWRNSLQGQNSGREFFDKIRRSNGWRSLTPFLLAVDNGLDQLVEMFLRSPHAREVSLEDPERDKAGRDRGCTALHLAVRKGYPKIVRLLLQAGAKVNVHSMYSYQEGGEPSSGEEGKGLPGFYGGKTPLQMALITVQGVLPRGQKGMRKRLISTIKLLLEAGADVDLEDFEGNSPRQLVAACGPDVLRVFTDILGEDFASGNP